MTPPTIRETYDVIQDLHAALCDAADYLACGNPADAITAIKGARDTAAAWIEDYEAQEESP
jgi:hypothetical protein